MATTLRTGSFGSEVKHLQSLLNAKLGLNPQLVADGRFGSKTQKAVADFQRRKNLKTDGVVGPLTWSALEGKSPGTTMSREEWIKQADRIASSVTGIRFPPLGTTPLQDVVHAAWKSFTYLQATRLKMEYRQDLQLASAEHYAYARAVTSAGGPIVFPLIVSASFGYFLAKALFEKLGLRQQMGQLVSQAKGYTTPASPDQLDAAKDGAEDGLKLHFNLSVKK